jgi:hypothetical protein
MAVGGPACSPGTRKADTRVGFTDVTVSIPDGQ